MFDAHDRAFAFFKGACTRGIYDNMKTAVEAVFTGKDRHYNRPFLQMCSHFLVQPVACTPASGWEKGQVENQVGLVRERFFTPRLRVRSLDELNAWLLDKCVAYAKAHRHPEEGDKTIWEMFEDEPLRAIGSSTMANAAAAGALCRPLRWVPQRAGFGIEDLHRAVRQQQVFHPGDCGRSTRRGSCLCRADRHSAGRRDRRRTCPHLWPEPDRL
jgi:hypothetical protein